MISRGGQGFIINAMPLLKKIKLLFSDYDTGNISALRISGKDDILIREAIRIMLYLKFNYPDNYARNQKYAEIMMVDKQSVQRVTPDTAKTAIDEGKAMMVCAYKDEQCRGMQIKGALLPSEFKTRTSELSKTQEIIFYCN